MLRRQPSPTRTDTLFPFTTLFRSISFVKPLSAEPFARPISRTAVLPIGIGAIAAHLLARVRRLLGYIGGSELLLAKSQERQWRYRRRSREHGGLRQPRRCLIHLFGLGGR